MTAGLTTLTAWPASYNQVASASPYGPVASRQACTRVTCCRVSQPPSSSKPAGELGQLLRRVLPSGVRNATTNFALAMSIPSTASIVAPSWRRVRSALCMQAVLGMSRFRYRSAGRHTLGADVHISVPDSKVSAADRHADAPTQASPSRPLDGAAVKRCPNIQAAEITEFGCGVDAVRTRATAQARPVRRVAGRRPARLKPALRDPRLT